MMDQGEYPCLKKRAVHALHHLLHSFYFIWLPLLAQVFFDKMRERSTTIGYLIFLFGWIKTTYLVSVYDGDRQTLV